jgi:hypothetical protein
VVAEVLRLYPPAYALFLRHAVNDVGLGSLPIRKGDLVQITPFTLQRYGRWFVEPEFSLPPAERIADDLAEDRERRLGSRRPIRRRSGGSSRASARSIEPFGRTIGSDCARLDRRRRRAVLPAGRAANAASATAP